MVEVTVYTKEQQDEVERIFTLLAGSNRWEHYVGLTRDTKKIDQLIGEGRTAEAANHLQWVARDSLTFEFASVAIRARQAYLDARDAEHPRPTSHLMEGCPTDEEVQLAQDAADQEEEEYVPLVEFVRGSIWKEGRGYGYFPKEGL